MKIYNVYKITNTINNKVYIGLTTNPRVRWNGHKHSGGFSNTANYSCDMYNDMRTYGIDKFSMEIIYQSTYGKHTKQYMERHFIMEYDSHNNGYNTYLTGIPIKVHASEKVMATNNSFHKRKYYEKRMRIAAERQKTCQG